MTWIIGIDEAGYGPTLGPLVIGGSLWHSTLPLESTLLLESASRFTRWTDGFLMPGIGTLRLADSKQLYSPSSGVKLLEASLWAALATIPLPAMDFRELFQHLTASDLPSADPWYSHWCPKPFLAIDETRFDSLLTQVASSLSTDPAMRLVQVAARVLEPQEFNEQCEQRGNKATVLTEQSLVLVQRLLQATDSGSVQVYCDKHGGRNSYAAALYHLWPDARLTIEQERREQSCYRMELSPDRVIHWHFTAKGDSHAPTALASMVAKYLRERLMDAWNDYWQIHEPDLKPTAGYPGDARRYLASIEPIALKLGIASERIRRNR